MNKQKEAGEGLLSKNRRVTAGTHCAEETSEEPATFLLQKFPRF